MRMSATEPSQAAVSARLGRREPAQLGPAICTVQDAGVAFGTLQALRDVSLSIAAGECVALVGANGSGKSTLLRLLHGLVRPSSGSCHIAPDLRQAMLFQRPFMLRSSARNNVALALWLRGTRWARAKALAMQALARVGLQDKAGQSARTLSGGQQQRLALARAWALQPDMLLLDEPTASLDPRAKRDVEQLIADFVATPPHANAGPGEPSLPLTLVFASHNLGQVKRLARRVIYLEQGWVLADLPVGEFFDAQRLHAVSPAAQLFVKGELA